MDILDENSWRCFQRIAWNWIFIDNNYCVSVSGMLRKNLSRNRTFDNKLKAGRFGVTTIVSGRDLRKYKFFEAGCLEAAKRASERDVREEIYLKAERLGGTSFSDLTKKISMRDA